MHGRDVTTSDIQTGNSIDPMHKWRQFKYSFVYIEISPTSLVLRRVARIFRGGGGGGGGGVLKMNGYKLVEGGGVRGHAPPGKF